MNIYKEELSGLVERVRGMKGPDREVDAAMAKIAGWHPNGYGCKMPDDVPAYWYSDAFGLPSYTGSVDAALDLAERTLPGWGVETVKSAGGGKASCRIYPGSSLAANASSTAFGSAPTPPLAIILALLLSLQSQEPTP